MAASLLSAVEPIIKGKSFEDICKATFPVSGLISREPVHAALQSAQELLSNDGIPLSNLKKSELDGFIKDAPTAEPGSFTLVEYQALLESLTKYAALKARHNNGKRWGLGLSLSTAGAMALTAAVFASASMMVVAVPAGAAVGAMAVAADGSRSRRRDRRTAKQGSSSSSRAPASALNTAAVAAAEEVQEPVPAADVAVEATPAPVMVEDSTLDIAPAGAEEEEAVMTASPAAAAPAPATTTAQEPVKESPAAIAAPAAAAAATAAGAAAVAVAPPAVPAPAAPTPAPVGSGNSSPRGSSEELVGAVVDFTPAAAPAAADSKPASHPTVDIDSAAAAAASADDDNVSLSDVPAPVQCDSPFSTAARDTGAAAYASELPADALLMPPAVRTSTGSDLLSNTSAAAAPSSGLPPKPKKSKSLTKSMSKKLKKAFSLKDKDVSSSKGSSADAGAHRALDADSADGSPLAPPVPPRKSGSFFRRSSDGSGGSFLRRSTDGSGSGSFFRRSSSDMGADGDSVDGSVERSKGSATIKKMVDGIRRSFSLERPSLELLSSKKARKADKAAAAL